MTDLDKSYLALASKIANLARIIDTLSVEEFPIADGEFAIAKLKAHCNKLQAYLSVYKSATNDVRIAIANQVTIKISNISHVLGIVARSNTTRNPFELHQPFKKLSQQFFENEIFLILSSEWKYVPFTHPMSIQDLPSFIVIGMPASESENVLVFPAAGHELGHSIWFKNELTSEFSAEVRASAENYTHSKPKLLEELFPKEGQAQDDLFGQYVNEMFVNAVVTACLAQIEELFCDFIAVGIFGRSYLAAFRYLLAPGAFGERSNDYPGLADRAAAINVFAGQLGYFVDDFEASFENERLPKIAYDLEVLKAADAVRETLHDKIGNLAESILRSAKVTSPRGRQVTETLQLFLSGMPTDAPVSIGELIEAAWDLFEQRYNDTGGSPAPLIETVSDLVLKSAEAGEFLEIVENA